MTCHNCHGCCGDHGTTEALKRAEDRNSNTANMYAQLGMTKYAAMEAFVRWHY